MSLVIWVCVEFAKPVIPFLKPLKRAEGSSMLGMAGAAGASCLFRRIFSISTFGISGSLGILKPGTLGISGIFGIIISSPAARLTTESDDRLTIFAFGKNKSKLAWRNKFKISHSNIFL